MKSALIGYTGFVGSNLDSQFKFNEKYNSKNIKDIENKEYDLVICSGIPASMWLANNFPEKDLENINSLLNILKTVRAKSFVLISSIAVFSQPVKNIDEDSQCFENDLAYGKNRRYAEKVIEDSFNNSLIIRLPALFGKGLKKNFIYDLLNQEPAFMPKDKFEQICNTLEINDQKLLKEYYAFDKSKSIYSFNKETAIEDNQRKNILNTLKKSNSTALKFTHAESSFQFYCLDILFEDIEIALKHNLSHLNLCSEPLKAKEVTKEVFNLDFNNDNGKEPFEYDMHTKYAKYWNKNGHHQYSKQEILKELIKFKNL